MSHLALPQTMTKENLGTWIAEHAIETRNHEEKIDFTKEEIAAFEHDLSIASIEIDALERIKAKFNETLKKGTPCIDVEEQLYDEVNVKIPGTKGMEILQANRTYAGEQIKLGHRIDYTKLYAIPYSGTGKIHWFDVEGNHWEQYDYRMNPLQMKKYGAPLFDDEEKPVETKRTEGQHFFTAVEKRSHSELKRGEDPEELNL